MFLATFTRAPLVVCAMTRTVSFCLAELWPRTNTHGSKILDFNACHILPPKYTLKPALIVQIHWDFTISAVYFGSTSVLKSSFPLHRRPKILLVNLWQLMTASNASVRTQAWKVGGFKIPGFVCKLFLPFFPTPPPPTLLLASFFALSLTLVPSSLLQSRMEMLSMQARPWTTSSPKNSLSSPTDPPMCDKCRL